MPFSHQCVKSELPVPLSLQSLGKGSDPISAAITGIHCHGNLHLGVNLRRAPDSPLDLFQLYHFDYPVLTTCSFMEKKKKKGEESTYKAQP